MTDADIMDILKTDVEISNSKLDMYLMQLIQSARSFIEREGVNLSCSVEDSQLIEMYAAYLYRRRDEKAGAEMPRMLRWALNNRIYGGENRPNG